MDEAPSLGDVLAAFLGGSARHYSEVESSVLSVGCEPLDDLTPVEALLPRSKAPVEDVVAWTTGLSNAPFLVLSRAAAPHPEESERVIVFRARRIWINDLEESALYDWITDFCGLDAAGKKEEAGGHYSWIWAVPGNEGTVLSDGFRLYVAGEDNMMLLERISAADR